LYKKTVFHFEQPFCSCNVLDLAWGMVAVNGAPCMSFQCRTCATAITIPLPKLNAGFEFSFKAEGVTVKGEEREIPNPEIIKEPKDSGLVVIGNVTYGPWAGVEIPEE